MTTKGKIVFGIFLIIVVIFVGAMYLGNNYGHDVGWPWAACGGVLGITLLGAGVNCIIPHNVRCCLLRKDDIQKDSGDPEYNHSPPKSQQRLTNNGPSRDEKSPLLVSSSNVNLNVSINLNINATAADNRQSADQKLLSDNKVTPNPVFSLRDLLKCFKTFPEHHPSGLTTTTSTIFVAKVHELQKSYGSTDPVTVIDFLPDDSPVFSRSASPGR